MPEEWRGLDAAGVGDRRDADDRETALLALDGDVEDHGVEAGLREQDHRVAAVEAVGPQDRVAVPLLLVQEPVLVGAHVAEDVVHQGDRQLDDRPEPGDRPRAREHLERGECAVAGAEREHEAIALDRVGARRGGGVDGIGLVVDDPVQPFGDRLEVAVNDGRHRSFSFRRRIAGGHRCGGGDVEGGSHQPGFARLSLGGVEHHRARRRRRWPGTTSRS